MPKFNPPFLLRNRHIQTLYAPLFRKQKSLDLEVQYFELDDGDFVECHWYNKPLKGSSTPIVTLFHGLEGSYASPYIQGIMRALSSYGYSVVIMHFRGCADKENLLPRAYHSGDTNDAKLWIEYIGLNYPNSNLYAIGYSIGGNVLLKLLSEWGDNSPLSMAVSVSAPMQLDISAKTIKKGFAKIYQRHLLKKLKASLLQKYKKHNYKTLINLDKERVKNISSIWEFDELFTAPIHGFGTAQNYYNLSSSKQYIHKITTPTLIIHALDDPFMTDKVLPTKKEISSSITLEITTNGGHVGFVDGSLFKPRYWLEDKIVSYFKESR